MRTLRIFISSPGDVAEERDRAKRVVEGLRKRYAGRLSLETVLWEELPLTATMTFQDGIEKVILAESYGVDVAVFVLWSRLGSPLGAGFRKRDGTPYRSGTEREFDLMLTAYEQSGQTRPQIFAYVRQDHDGFIEAQRGKDTSALSEMIRQRELLETFIREEFQDPETGANLRAYHTFPQPSTFAVRLRQHLRALLDEMAAEAGVPVDQQWEDEPYLGLRAFDLQHAPIFFGREQETGAVLEALQQQQRNGCAFVLLVGGSGSGKSSLVRAGVIPDLLESGDEEGISWRRAVLTPGECAAGLLPGLARALLAKDALPELREDDGSLQELAADFASAPKQAAQQVRRALQRVSSGPTATHLVLLVDQFEEVFTHAGFSEADIRVFAEALKALAECTRVSILATVRSDFYGRCQQVPSLMAMKSSAGQIDLVAPAPAALARIIGRPAQLAGLHFEENPATGETLDQRILADIGNNPEALPLVEFALTQLWENRAPDGKLTFARYEALGGVAGAIGHHAENVFNALPDAVRAEFAAVFNALVTLNEADDAQAVRRRVALEAVTGTPARKHLVEALTHARLLTSDRGEVFVAHEALLRVWPKAQDWINSNRDLLRTRARMDASLLRWKAENKHRDYLLPEGKPLADAQELQKQWHAELSSEQHDYITRSATHHEERRKKRLRLYQLASTVLLLLAVLAVIGGVMAWQQTSIAREQTQRADKESADKQENLEAASNADLASALKAWQEDFDAQQKGERSVGFNGKSRWHEAVALLARSLERNPKNQRATDWLYDTIRHQCSNRRDWTAIVLKHERWVSSASFSLEGTRVLTASGDGTARVWDVASGKFIGEPLRHKGVVCSANFSQDGTRGVTASWDHTARVWDAATSKPIGEPLRHEDIVRSASFSPDGTRVVTASDDFTARVWDAATGKPIGEPLRHEKWLTCASFSPDGTRVVTASYDKTARMWDAATGKPLGERLRHDDAVWSASFSSDGTRVVTASRDKTAQVWDAATSKPIGEPLRHEDIVRSASFSPDGTRVVTASDDFTARVWDAATGKPIGEPLRHTDMVNIASFSPDGMRVVTASSDKTARVWDAATGKPIGESLRHTDMVNIASFSPDGARIVTACGELSKPGYARVWVATIGKPIGEPLRHEKGVNSASFSPDGTRVVAASEDRTARMWDAATGKLIGEPLRHEKGVNSASFSPDGTRVVTASGDRTARVWDVATGKPIGEPLRHKDIVWSASFSPDGTRVVTVCLELLKTGYARVWDVTTGKLIGEPLRHEVLIYSASFSPDGTRVVTASFDTTARVWDAASGKPIGEPLCHGDEVKSASFSPDGTRVVTASDDDTARVWDAATGKPIGEPLRHEKGVISASFSPDGTWVVTASGDGTARVWDAVTSKLIGEPLRHEKGVISASFSPDGMRVVTVSANNIARVWDAASGKSIGEPLRHEKRVNSASFSPDGMRVVTASGDGTARIWDVPTHAPFTNSGVLAWVNVLAGLRYREDGEIEEIPHDERITLLPRAKDSLPSGWKGLAECVFDTRPDRRLSIRSRFTVRQIAERERDFNGDGMVESLTSALEYDFTLPLARLLLANALEKENAAKKPEEQDATIPARAAHLRRYDLDRLPEDAHLWTRAAKALNDAPASAMVGIGSKAITPAAAALQAAEKALALKPNDPAAQDELERAKKSFTP